MSKICLRNSALKKKFNQPTHLEVGDVHVGALGVGHLDVVLQVLLCRQQVTDLFVVDLKERSLESINQSINQSTNQSSKSNQAKATKQPSKRNQATKQPTNQLKKQCNCTWSV